METVFVKILAAALAFSQVAVNPQAVKTQFSRAEDQRRVAELLQAGCRHMMDAFAIENINIDDLIETAMNDPQAVGADKKEFHGINFGDLHTAYRQFCKREQTAQPAVDLGEVIDFYNKAADNLPDLSKLNGLRLPGVSVVLDGGGRHFAEMFQENQRSSWISLSKVPIHVRNAFIAAEDKRFYQHRGVDERGLVRAFLNNLTQAGRREGGSTITQQLVKNQLVGDDRTYERKIRETIIATRVESAFSKDQILELYLNSVYLGRGTWGIERAARNYFDKSASDLTLEEGALLAGLTKGPNYFSPDRQPIRAQGRLAYVLGRMQEDGMLSAAESSRLRGRPGLPPLPAIASNQRPRRDIGFYFMDEVVREVKSVASINELTTESYRIRSTINPQLQRATEEALQEGLFQYERDNGRLEFQGAEANLSQAIARIEAEKKPAEKRPSWQEALMSARLPLYDVHWTPAVVLETPASKKGAAWRVGLADGRTLPVALDPRVQRKLKIHDVVLVHLSGGKGRAPGRAQLRIRPEVQGAVVVLENKTGRILAMAGGFSYPLSQLNRTTQSTRQPGSTIKPLTYLAALGKGLQPDTLVSDDEITLRPIGARVRGGREPEYWSPKNYDSGGGGVLTMRAALENSRNRATVHLLDGGIEQKPEASLNRICDLAVEAQIYRECQRVYPVVLGAQPVRPVDLAAFYAAIANEGKRPAPYAVESIERDGETIFRHHPNSVTITSVDPAAFYQLKTMLQGVVARGTARSIASLSPYVAGKTGTSDEENDAWFVGFTNDVTVAVWLGYDNAGGRRRTLGSGSTGGGVAVPVFEPIVEAVWTHVASRRALAPPSADARRQLSCSSIDVEPAESRRRSRTASTECLRLDRRGRIIDTRYRLVSREGETQDREEIAIRERAERAYGLENQSQWSWSGPWQGAQWRSRSENRWHGRHHLRAFPVPRPFSFMFSRHR
ncbi:MAG TPA: PBP1A family penicillin-binding protein [Xanthobacteraceae bacterium]|nr:PBP1A family penicillin-binding protein [Xanthobacteraceae bacterium]